MIKRISILVCVGISLLIRGPHLLQTEKLNLLLVQGKAGWQPESWGSLRGTTG